MKRFIFIALVFMSSFIIFGCEYSSTNLSNESQKKAKLSCEELEYLLELDPNSEISYCLEDIIDNLIQFDEYCSLFLIENTYANKLLCLYINNDIYVESLASGDYQNIYDHCELIEYDNIESIEKVIDEQELLYVYCVYNMTIQSDLISGEKINKEIMYYENYTSKYNSSIAPNSNTNYYMLYSSKDIIEYKYIDNIDSSIRRGDMYQLLVDDLNYYIILIEQYRDENGILDEMLKQSSQKYYEDIYPHLIEDESLLITKQINDKMYYYDRVKLDLNNFIDIVKGVSE